MNIKTWCDYNSWDTNVTGAIRFVGVFFDLSLQLQHSIQSHLQIIPGIRYLQPQTQHKINREFNLINNCNQTDQLGAKLLTVLASSSVFTRLADSSVVAKLGAYT